MKKLIFLFSLVLAVFLTANAQEDPDYDYKVNYDATWTTYNMPTGTNATTSSDSIWYFTVLKESKAPVKYDFKISLDSVGGTYKTVPIILQGKKFKSDAFTNVTTLYWTTGRDTVKTFTQNSTGQYYRYWRVYIKSNNKGFIFRVPELSVAFKE